MVLKQREKKEEEDANSIESPIILKAPNAKEMRYMRSAVRSERRRQGLPRCRIISAATIDPPP